MRIGIVSDIHGNAAGLEAALDRLGSFDELWCAGDAVDESGFSAAVVGRLRELDARYVLGNHEYNLLRSPACHAADPELVRWLELRPKRIACRVGGRRIVMVHATPWAPFSDYVYPHSPDFERFTTVDADLVIYGHTHVEIAVQMAATWIVNPGSAGLAQNPGNGGRLSCARLDTRTMDIDLQWFAPPRSQSAGRMTRADVPV